MQARLYEHNPITPWLVAINPIMMLYCYVFNIVFFIFVNKHISTEFVNNKEKRNCFFPFYG